MLNKQKLFTAEEVKSAENKAIGFVLNVQNYINCLNSVFEARKSAALFEATILIELVKNGIDCNVAMAQARDARMSVYGDTKDCDAFNEVLNKAHELREKYALHHVS